MQSDRQLVIRARRGDRQAFDLLVRQHYECALRAARRFAVITEDAADLVQESFVTAFERLHQLAEPDKFAAWLATIVRNEGLMWRRRRNAQPTLFSLDGVEADAEPGLASISMKTGREIARRAVIRDSIADALAVLTTQQRMAVTLHYIEGYNYRETAKLLDVPICAVRGRLDRARSTLRKELQEMATNLIKEFQLDACDLHALRSGALCACKDTNPRPINTLFFTGNGQVVSTDTCRLFCYTSPSIKNVPKALVHADMGRILLNQHREANRAKLILKEKNAVLRMDDGTTISADVVEGTYPNWEKVIPTEFGIRCTALAADWLDALAMLAGQRESVTSQEIDKPRVVVALSPEEARITLREGEEPSSDRRISWQISASFPAEFPTTGPDFIAAFNPIYIEQAIRAIGIPPEGSVEFLANEPLTPMMVRPAGSQNVFVLTMPMEIPAPVPVSTT